MINKEKLIEMVRHHPEIYDMNHPKYLDNDYKNVLWNQIAKQCNSNAAECRKVWKNIRDCYRKSLVKYTATDGQRARKIKPYMYTPLMGFIDEFLEERDNLSTTKNQWETQELSDDADDTYDSAAPENEENAHEDGSQVDFTAIANFHAVTSSNSEPDGATHLLAGTWGTSLGGPGQLKTNKRLAKAADSSAAPRKPAAGLMEHLLEKQDDTENSSPQNPVDAFLAGLAPALKTLSPLLWHHAKADIFAAVQKYEYQMLVNQQNILEPVCSIKTG